MALYVYGIMRPRDAARAVDNTEGDADIEAVEHGGISAIVSTAAGSELRLRRNNILAHAEVVQAAFEHGPVLPFRLGTVITDASTVMRQVLAPRADQLAARLDALDGKVEMQLKAVYREEPLLRSILAQDPALARSVQRTQGSPAAATHFERIRIGEAIAAAVQTRGAVDGRALIEALAPLSVVHVISPPHHERAVANVAFLVDRAELPGFDQAVEALSQQHGGEIEFKLIGPMPAYSFADSDWSRNTRESSTAWA